MQAFICAAPVPRLRGARSKRCRPRSSNTPAMEYRAGPKFDIASVGNMCVDINLPISHYPVENGLHQRLRFPARLEIGGSLNALIAATRLSARTAAIAFINEDDGHPSDILVSNYLKSAATRIGIDTSGLLPYAHGQVPTCATLFDSDGNHTFLASNEEKSDESSAVITELPLEMASIIANTSSLIIDGYALHSDRQLVRLCVDAAIRGNCQIWLDPQAATSSLLRDDDPLFRYLLSKVTGLSVTLDEAMKLTNEDYPVAVLEELKQVCSAKTVLLKDGPRGSHAMCGDEYSSAMGFDIGGEFADSVGAGDSFLGAFVACQGAGLKLDDCIVVANAMGAATCMRHGGGVSGVGTLDRVASFVDKMDGSLIEKVAFVRS